eukprot:TRINITY_DN185_c0_g1_i1.p1 TRINITY_DN185_c0_g1~~TRINITY_DN185_c0_g1_i1.p1  ORF type:complete len:332 (-),score=31.01 TRINITY_DN185_c0_g1_i1:132-1127(-)
MESPWYFLTIVEAWPLSHIFLPFTSYLVTRSYWITMGIVFYNEFFESLTYALMGSYVVFAGEGDAKETQNDSAIGDPINGMIGIILCWYFTKLFEIPQLFPGPYTIPRLLNNWKFYLRNFLGIVAMCVGGCFIKLHYHDNLGECGFPTGVTVFMCTSVLTVIALYFLNKSPECKDFVFNESPGTLQGINYRHRFSVETRYNAAYLGWGLTMLAGSCSFLCSWDAGYFIGIKTTLLLMLAYTIAWYFVDYHHRKQTDEPFSFGNMFGLYQETAQISGSPSTEGKRRKILKTELLKEKEEIALKRYFPCPSCGVVNKIDEGDGANSECGGSAQ